MQARNSHWFQRDFNEHVGEHGFVLSVWNYSTNGQRNLMHIHLGDPKHTGRRYGSTCFSLCWGCAVSGRSPQFFSCHLSLHFLCCSIFTGLLLWHFGEIGDIEMNISLSSISNKYTCKRCFLLSLGSYGTWAALFIFCRELVCKDKARCVSAGLKWFNTHRYAARRAVSFSTLFLCGVGCGKAFCLQVNRTDVSLYRSLVLSGFTLSIIPFTFFIAQEISCYFIF